MKLLSIIKETLITATVILAVWSGITITAAAISNYVHLTRENAALRALSAQNLSPDSEVARSAWKTALRLAKVKEPWAVPSKIMVFPFNNARVWGETFTYTVVDPNGTPHLYEQIMIYTDPRLGPLATHNVLVHEMLHCIYTRLVMRDPGLAMEMSTETYVCTLGACPRDPSTASVEPKD